MRPPGPTLFLKYVLSAFTNKSKRCSTWQHHAGWQPSRDIGTFLTHPPTPSLLPSVQGQQDGASDRLLRYRVFYRTAFASAKNTSADCCCLNLYETILGGVMASLCRRQITPLSSPLSASLCRLFARSSEDFSEHPEGNLQSVMGCWLLQWMKEEFFCATT